MTVSPRALARKAKWLLRRRPLLRRPQVTRYPGDDPAVLDCVIAYNPHGGYCVPVSAQHRYAAQALLAGRVWEPETIDYMVRACGSGDIVHAGTFFGDFLPAIARGCADGARVWAFEPNPVSYRCASVTVAINGLANVSLTNAALGAEARSQPLRVGDAEGRPLGGASTLVGADDPAAGAVVEAAVVTIDAQIPADRDVAIIQLDVEGFEQAALEGGLDTIRRSTPVLLLESVPEASWVDAHLGPLGYRHAGKVHENHIYAVG